MVIESSAQLSVAVASNAVPLSRNSQLLSAVSASAAGQLIMGGWTSEIVTVNVHVAVFPAASSAVTVTIVVPSGKIEPGAWLYVVSTTAPQLSVGNAMKLATAEQESAGFVPNEILPGQLGAGGVVSFTVTMKEQVASLLDASVAVATMIVCPTGKTVPGS